MLDIQAAQTPREGKRDSRLGLALAGGGPVGGIYQIGALLALAESTDGLDLNDLNIYVGVSSGGLVASALANQVTIEELCQVFVRSESMEQLFAPEEVFFKPAFVEYIRRALTVPELVMQSVVRFLTRPFDTKLSASLSNLGQAIPTGVYNNRAISDFLIKFYGQKGRTDDFRKLKRKLYVVATDLNTAESIVFGSKGNDHVPISKALQASSALPGLYSPVEIGGRHYVDGVLRKTLHASAALKERTDLLLCVNPIIPFDASLASSNGSKRLDNLVDGGLPVVLSQTFRTVIYSRMVVGMRKYGDQYKQADIMLFLPDRGDPKMFFTNVFSYANRRHVCEHAYQTTRKDLLARYTSLRPLLARHGVTLRKDVLKDADRHYWLVDAHAESV